MAEVGFDRSIKGVNGITYGTHTQKAEGNRHTAPPFE
jgi:hypothetical protein